MSSSFITPTKDDNPFSNIHTIGSDKLQGDQLLFTTFQVVKDLHVKCTKILETLVDDGPRARNLVVNDIKDVMDIILAIDGNLEKHMRLDRKLYACKVYLSSLKAETNTTNDTTQLWKWSRHE